MSYSSFELLNQANSIVVFGRDGQVGKALQVCLKDLKVPTVFLGKDDCDLSNESSIQKILDYYQPQVIINAAAYTAVDKAESERELAFSINAKAPAVMAHYMANIANGILIHYSTDYVFADTKQTAYSEMDATGPLEQLSVYGQSKLAGEKAIEEAFNMAKDSGYVIYKDKFPKYFIFRTSWVYGDGDNFIRKMLSLAIECDQLKVVADQVGAPTSAQWLAEIAKKIVGSRVQSGIYHVVPDGETSRHALALFAIETAVIYGQDIEVKPENVLPISATEYHLLRSRPYNSRLNNGKLKKLLADIGFAGSYPKWQDQVRAYLSHIVTKS